MAEKELVPVRSDSNGGPGESWLGGPLSLSHTSGQMTSSSGSERLDVEVPSPPLAIISSRVKSANALENCSNFETATVRYSYETTTLGRLLKAVGERLRGRRALSVALVVHGVPGCFKLCSQKTVTCASLREDEEIRKFFLTLVSSYLNSHSQYTRIDILNCPVAQNQEGEQLIDDMESLLGVPVFAYNDIQGAHITEAGSPESGRYSRIGTLYFDNEKLKDWSATAHQTMALFERIRTVGKGAYGAAVLYRKKDDGSHVILKEINLMDLKKTERLSAMNEAQILSRLDHPNIISYYDNFEEDGVLMIEMEYADGGTLAQFLQKQSSQNKSVSEKEVVTMFSQMVDALKYLHDHNILHRDLKTANVFLTKEGIVKLGDFGISKILSATSPEANTVLGTPYYISPEICEGKNYDSKSDIWALGCILYEMVCLQKTFEGTNLPVLVHKIVEVSFAPVKGDYSDCLKQLITEMLKKNPEERPSAKEIFTATLPILASQFASDEDEDIDRDESTKTHTKSLLYYLDGVSLLLNKIPSTFQARLDHIAVGYGHALALADEGMVFSWGQGSKGQLGHGDREMRKSPSLIESIKGKKIVRVECGGEFSVLVADNGILMTCGRGDTGTQGHHDNQDCLKPKLVEDLITHDVVQVGCGEGHVAVVTSENRVLLWGAGQWGQLGTGDEDDRNYPVEITVHSPGSKMAEVICNVKCGLDGTMMLTETGRLFACGNNQDNKLGLNRRETFIMQMRKILNKDRQLKVSSMSVPTPLKELGKHRVVDMSLGPTHSTVLAELGRVFTFGRNTEGQLCTGNTLTQNVPVLVKHHRTTPTMVTSSELCTIVTTDDNSFLIWGSRPVVQSPLLEIHEQTNSSHPPPHPPSLFKCNSVFAEDHGSGPGTPNTKRTPSYPPRSDPPPLKILEPSMNRVPSPGETPPAKKSSLSDLAARTSPPKATSRDSVGSQSRITGLGSRHQSFDFSEFPHSLIPCTESRLYLNTLSQVLTEQLDVSCSGFRTSGGRGGDGGGGGVGGGVGGGGKSASLKREASSGSQLVAGGTGSRKAHSTSSISTNSGNRDSAIITQPTAMDLVGRSGILNLLSVEGITEAKLEGLSCYGSNVLVLIQTQVVIGSPNINTEQEGEGRELGGKKMIKTSSRSSKELPTFKFGRRITQRKQWRRISPFHPPPPLHASLPPPLHPPVTPPPPHPPAISSPTADDPNDPDDSMVETWLKEVYEEAKREGEISRSHNTDSQTEQKNIKKVKTEAWKNCEPRSNIDTPDAADKERKSVIPKEPSTSRKVSQPPQATDKNSQLEIHVADSPNPRKQSHIQLLGSPPIKQAASTSNVSGEWPKKSDHQKIQPHVKRVSSSGDVSSRAITQKQRPHIRVNTAAPRVRAKHDGSSSPSGSVSRKMSNNEKVKGSGEKGATGFGAKAKTPKFSLPANAARYPSATRKENVRGTPNEGSSSSVNEQPRKQSSVEQLSSGNSAADKSSPKPLGAKHHCSISECSPYAAPVARVIHPGSKKLSQVKPRSPSSAKHISTSERTLHKRQENHNKGNAVSERELKESQEREKEMKEHIKQLESKLEKQQSQIESTENAMKEMNLKLQEMQQDKMPAATGRRRRSVQLLRVGSRASGGSHDDSTNSKDRPSKTRFCTIT